MKKKPFIAFAVAQTLWLVAASSPSFAVTVTTTYNDALSTGEWNGPNTATTTQAATVMAVADGECFKAVIVNPFTFSYAATITLPTLGATFGGAFVDQTFVDSTKVHENWHDAYARALLASTYGRLETWSASYVSNMFTTAAAALAAGNADLAAALAAAKAAFQNDFATDTTNPAFGHQNAVAVIEKVNNVDTWRSQNPDWGAAAVAFAKTINPAFTKTPGNCPVPEPSTGVLLFSGAIAFAIAGGRRRHSLRKVA